MEHQSLARPVSLIVKLVCDCPQCAAVEFSPCRLDSVIRDASGFNAIARSP